MKNAPAPWRYPGFMATACMPRGRIGLNVGKVHIESNEGSLFTTTDVDNALVELKFHAAVCITRSRASSAA